MSTYSDQIAAHLALHGPEVHVAGGNATRATGRTKTSEIKSATKDMEEVITGPITRLLGIQTGVSGFVLSHIKSETASNLSGTQMDFSFKDQTGKTYHFTAYPDKA